MRVVITGGTGLIGRALTANLAPEGHEVVVVSRSPRQTQPLPENVRFETWDGRTAAGWGAAVDGAAAVINLAGASIAGEGFLPGRWTSKRKKLILDSRVDAGRAVIEAIKGAASPPEVVVQASAVGYYGPRQSEDITEDAPAGNDFPAGVCRQWEASTAEVEPLGVRRVVIRTGVVLSKEGGALPRMALPFKLFAGGPLGSGRQQLSWVHIADVVAAIRFLIGDPAASGPYNLAAPNPLSNADFGRVLGKVLRRPAFVPTPGFAFRIAFGEVSNVLLTGQRALPARLLAAGYTFRYPEAEGALRQIYNR